MKDFKVRFLGTDEEQYFIDGKVYAVINGFLKDERGYEWGIGKFSSDDMSNLSDYMSSMKYGSKQFELVKEKANERIK